MAHILARLTGVKYDNIKRKLEEDAPYHAEQHMYLQHLWTNAENPDEVLFLFEVHDLKASMELMKKTHAEARQQDPDVNLPELTFLDAA